MKQLQYYVINAILICIGIPEQSHSQKGEEDKQSEVKLTGHSGEHFCSTSVHLLIMSNGNSLASLEVTKSM